MELHQIRYFLSLCDELNFTRAAQRCKISQPSLTMAVKELERVIGGRLFDRGPRGARLTELGLLMRPHFERLDQCTQDARRDADHFLDQARVHTETPRRSE
jgi:DNA-binding transcriptional LysR family regulator